MWPKTKEFFQQNESKIVLLFGFVLVAVLSFEAGMIKGQTIRQNSVIVNNSGSESICGTTSGQLQEASNLTQEAAKMIDNKNIPAQTMPIGRLDCALVGSKNSNKYHLPACRWAKNIKPENIVCFSDENGAKLKGYQADKNCIK